MCLTPGDVTAERTPEESSSATVSPCSAPRMREDYSHVVNSEPCVLRASKGENPSHPAPTGHSAGEHFEIDARAADRMSFDDRVKDVLSSGINLTQRDALMRCIRDHRLSHQHRVVLVEVIAHTNNSTGTAFPGRKLLAERTGYTEQGVAKALYELRAFGYIVNDKRAGPDGGRALMHYAVVRPTREELQAAISDHVASVRRMRHRRADVTTRSNVSPRGNISSDVTPKGNIREADVTPVVSADVTPVVPTVTSYGTRSGSEKTLPQTSNVESTIKYMHIRDANAHAPPSASLVGAGQAGAEDEPDAADLEQLDMGWAPPAGAADLAPDPEAKPKRATPRPKATEEQFVRFWEVYPLRKGKAKASLRFMALTPEDAELAIAAAKKYAAECISENREKRHIKWPEGWLNDRRFEDDDEPQRAIASQHDHDVRIVNGRLELLNGKHAEWLTKFKTEERLALALTEARGRINPSFPLLAAVEGQLARILRFKLDDDERARAREAARNPTGKPLESIDEDARIKRIMEMNGLTDEGGAS